MVGTTNTNILKKTGSLLFGIIIWVSLYISAAQAQTPLKSLKFIPNQGQWEKPVKYRADLPGGKLFLENNALTYLFYDTRVLAELHHNHEEEQQHGQAQEESHEDLIKLHAFKVVPLGANLTPQLYARETCPELYNYYIGNDPSRWASGVKASHQVTYKNIYPATDLRLFQSGASLKYEFILAPGADPKSIKLQYQGLQQIYLKSGDLVLQTSVNTITEKAPYVYQTINGHEIPVKSRFHLKDSIVTFDLLGRYDPKYPLIIDPQLIFSTYSGSTADNWGNTAAYDEMGNMYSGGSVFGAGYPTTLGAYQVSFAGTPHGPPPFYTNYGLGIDVGILKFNTTGTSLLYATYLGGFYTETPYSLVVNRNDELVILGTTSSANFPTTPGAYDNTFNGGTNVTPVSGIRFFSGSDIFVSRLSSNGSALLASTYVGGSGNEGIQLDFEALTKNYGDQLRGDVITDSLNNIYIACNTRSADFPVNPSALQTTKGTGKDAVVFKLSNDMSTLMWSTFLGGNGEDVAYSIQVDSLLHVYVSGGTTSTNFPVTTGVLQPAYQGGIDAFVSHLSNDGQVLLHSTYTGTAAYDQAYFVQLDQNQNVYLLGQTQGAYPVIGNGVYNNPNSGLFIHALTPELDSTLFSTVVGNGGFQPKISPTAFLVNVCGNIFISGWGGITNPAGRGYIGGNTSGMPVTPDAYRAISDGSDFYIMVLSDSAKNLLYATYFGMNDPTAPDHVDGGTSRFDKKGIIYEAVCGGCGNNDNFPTTPGAWSRTNNSFNCNNAAFKFDLTSLSAQFNVSRDDSCGKSVISLNNLSTGGISFFWDFGDGQTSNLTSPPPHNYPSPGTYPITLIVTDLTTCIGKDTANLTVVVPPPPVVTFGINQTQICSGGSVQFSATYNATYTYLWTPGLTLNDSTIANPIAFPLETTTYHGFVEDTNQCQYETDFTVTVLPSPPLDAGPDQTLCPGNTTQLSAQGIGTFIWEISPFLSCSVCQSPTLSPLAGSDQYYTVEITDPNGCKSTDSLRVITRPLPVITVALDWEGRCSGENVYFSPAIFFSDLSCPVAGNFLWNFGDGNTSTEEKPTHQYLTDGIFQVTVQFAHSNIARDTLLILSKDSCLKNIYVPNTFTPNGDGQNDKVYLRTINATKIKFYIYNRWGEEVFRTESLEEGWDGTYKGVKQSPQVFTYTAFVTFYDDTEETKEGNITLME